jgi:hypothetical protein
VIQSFRDGPKDQTSGAQLRTVFDARAAREMTVL